MQAGTTFLADRLLEVASVGVGDRTQVAESSGELLCADGADTWECEEEIACCLRICRDGWRRGCLGRQVVKLFAACQVGEQQGRVIERGAGDRGEVSVASRSR